LQDGGIADRLEKRRHNFMENNKDSILIKHAETLIYSEWRRIRVRNTHRDRALRKLGWKTNLHLHKEHKFFSNDFIENIEEEDNNITKENNEEDNDNKKENTNNEKRNINDKKKPQHCAKKLSLPGRKHSQISNQIPQSGDTSCKVQIQTWT